MNHSYSLPPPLTSSVLCTELICQLFIALQPFLKLLLLLLLLLLLCCSDRGN